jgi:hypothetical protein
MMTTGIGTGTVTKPSKLLSLLLVGCGPLLPRIDSEYTFNLRFLGAISSAIVVDYNAMLHTVICERGMLHSY